MDRLRRTKRTKRTQRLQKTNDAINTRNISRSVDNTKEKAPLVWGFLYTLSYQDAPTIHIRKTAYHVIHAYNIQFSVHSSLPQPWTKPPTPPRSEPERSVQSRVSPRCLRTKRRRLSRKRPRPGINLLICTHLDKTLLTPAQLVAVARAVTVDPFAVSSVGALAPACPNAQAITHHGPRKVHRLPPTPFMAVIA